MDIFDTNFNMEDMQVTDEVVFNILRGSFKRDVHKTRNIGSTSAEYMIDDSECRFKFSDLGTSSCSLIVSHPFYGEIFSADYPDFVVFQEDMALFASDGIPLNGDDVLMVVDESNKITFGNSTVDAYDTDEEVEEDSGSKFSGESGVASRGIVPDFKQIRVVSLKLDGEIIAFRFKTDVGSFDMRRSTAVKYGLAGYKTERFISLLSVNGLLLTRSEIESHTIIPDISECDEDCKKLINAIFRG